MKTRNHIVLGLASLALFLGASFTAAGQADEKPAVMLERAIQLETVDGNLDAAIDLYKKVVAAGGNERAIAAKALLRMGKCYEKLGRGEARKAYERLVSDYADQSEQAREARSRLAALARPGAEGKESAFATRLVWAGADGVFTNAPSPDGRFMTYVDYRQSGNLGVRDLEAGTSRLLTTDGTWEQPVQMAYSSRWSPDGKQLAYCWQYGTRSQLRALAVDDPKPRILFEDKGDDSWVEPTDWSPDGRHILTYIGRTDGAELVLVPVDGGSPRVLKKFEPGTITSREARFSPEGSFIVYDRTPGKVAALDIFALGLRGGEEAPLVRHPADDCVFGWSPDGNWVLFLSDRSGTLGLWAIRVADGKPQGIPLSVKSSTGRIASLGFARDGSFYYADVKVARDIYTVEMDLDSGKILTPPQKAVTRYEGSNQNPSYSPDGKSLAYVSRRGSIVFPTNYANALCIQSLETGSEHVFMDEFVRLGVRHVGGPRWSPDSRSIVVAGGGAAGSARNGLYRVDLETGRVTALIETPRDTRILNHVFSRDRRRLFYIRYVGSGAGQGTSRILEIDPDTGEEKETASLSGTDLYTGIAASPDGQLLATFTRSGALSVMSIAGGPARLVHSFGRGRYANPVWTPDGKYLLIGGILPDDERRNILYRVPAGGGEPLEIALPLGVWARSSIHPDGRRFAFTMTINADTDADVWVLRNFLPESQPKR